MALTIEKEGAKLEHLAEDEGMSVEEFIDWYALDSIVPGICTNARCDWCENVEPDAREGWCPECETGSIVSGLVLAGII